MHVSKPYCDFLKIAAPQAFLIDGPKKQGPIEAFTTPDVLLPIWFREQRPPLLGGWGVEPYIQIENKQGGRGGWGILVAQGERPGCF